MVDPLERAAALRQEADIVLDRAGLLENLSTLGPVTPTGSYYLDLMAYPDIDLQVPAVPIPALFQAAGRIAQNELVTALNFEKSDDPGLPGGLYLKARVQYGDWGRPWKVDIWSLDEALIARRMAEMRHFQQLLTPQLREQNIRFKASILTPELRTPMYSGYFIYKAFLEEGLRDPAAVTAYLVKNGIQLASTPSGMSSPR
jgi:hypothetical protein